MLESKYGNERSFNKDSQLKLVGGKIKNKIME